MDRDYEIFKELSRHGFIPPIGDLVINDLPLVFVTRRLTSIIDDLERGHPPRHPHPLERLALLRTQALCLAAMCGGGKLIEYLRLELQELQEMLAFRSPPSGKVLITKLREIRDRVECRHSFEISEAPLPSTGPVAPWHRLRLAFHRGRSDDGGANVSGIDIGRLIDSFTEEPGNIARGAGKGYMKLELQRTHEWEIVLGVIIGGAGVFFTAVLTELAKRLVSFIAGHRSRRTGVLKAKIYGATNITILISENDSQQRREQISRWLTDAMIKGSSIIIVLDPDQEEGV